MVVNPIDLVSDCLQEGVSMESLDSLIRSKQQFVSKECHLRSTKIQFSHREIVLFEIVQLIREGLHLVIVPIIEHCYVFIGIAGQYADLLKTEIVSI